MDNFDLEKEIDEIAGGEWWKRGGREDYLQLVRDMEHLGVPTQEAVRILSVAFGAAAEEFGN